MADRVIRWFVPGDISQVQTEVGGRYRMDADYVPAGDVYISCKVAPGGTQSLIVDITSDDVSIFTYPPQLNSRSDKVWSTMNEVVIREGAILKLNINQVANLKNGQDLTVELPLNKV